MSEIPTPNQNDILPAPGMYKTQVERVVEVCRPGDEITKKQISDLGNPRVIVIGNSKLKPQDFNLRILDTQSIDGFAIPGKSAILDFLGLSRLSSISPNDRLEVINRALGKRISTADRRDCIYSVPFEQLTECNFRLFYLPLRTNQLHMRIVHVKHIGLEYPIGDESLLSIPEYDRTRLVNFFVKTRKL